MPRRATADPPSGIAAAVVPAENANLVDLGVPRLGSFAVNIQVPAVPVPKAPPLIVPVPVTDTVPAPWLKIEDEIKSKVKPPTLQKAGYRTRNKRPRSGKRSKGTRRD